MLDQTERNKLIHQHLGYVRSLAAQVKKELSPQLDLEELVAYGSKGLVEAAERFDATRGVSFLTTFSYYRIRGAMFDGLRQIGWLSRSEYARFASASNDYLSNLGDRTTAQEPPSSPEAALQELSTALDDVAAIFIVSLGTQFQEDPPDVAQPDVSQKFEAEEARASVQRAIGDLPEKEKHLIELYYFQGLTLEKAGKELGLSKSWASRLHARAIHLLAEKLGPLSG